MAPLRGNFSIDAMDIGLVNRDRGILWWGVAALALAAFTSVYAAGFVVVTHSATRSYIGVSVPSTAPDSTPKLTEGSAQMWKGRIA